MKHLIQGTQGSNQTSIDSPSPMRKQAPLLTTSLAFLIAFQVGDAYLDASALS